MLPENTRCELCCFVATLLGFVGFVLAIYGVLAGLTSEPRLPWLAASGIAFALMIAAIMAAALIGRRRRR